MPAEQRTEVSDLGKGVVLHYGFMDRLDAPRDLVPLTVEFGSRIEV